MPIFLPASFPVQHVKSSGVEWGWITVMSSPDCLVTGERCLNVCFGVSHVESVQLPSLLLRRILCTNFNLFFYNTWVNMLCHSRFLDWILFYVGCMWLWISSIGRWQRWEKPLDLVFVYDDKLPKHEFRLLSTNVWASVTATATVFLHTFFFPSHFIPWI